MHVNQKFNYQAFSKRNSQRSKSPKQVQYHIKKERTPAKEKKIIKIKSTEIIN